MKRTMVSVLVLFSSVAAANAADFDIEAYCHEVSKPAADREQAAKACRQREENAKAKLSRMSVPAGVESRCTDIAKGVGGSYTVMDECIQQVMAAEKDTD